MNNFVRLICGMFLGYTSGYVMTTINTGPFPFYMHWITVILTFSGFLLLHGPIMSFLDWLDSFKTVPVHPVTGLPFGDLGKPRDILEFVFDVEQCNDSPIDQMEFIERIWHGEVRQCDEDYYRWLRKQRS